MIRMFSRRPDIRQAVAALARYNIPDIQREVLTDFLLQATDRELFHLNPRYLAEKLQIDERSTLRLLLLAMNEGLFTLHWDVRCPMCGSVNHRGDSLTALHHDDNCGVCRASFAPRLDDEVQVTFTPHERLRPLSPNAEDALFRSEISQRLGVTPGHTLLLMSEFQRFFPQQRLLPDESLNVARVAVLFTDLAGSTAIYARKGDPRAYHLVRLHFDELFRIANANDGLMVKTIGDAVMAAFETPLEAMTAALAMQKAIAELNTRAAIADDERLILKVGVHAGPSLSVTLNDRPDYFGTTVNIAARVQGLSHGNDIVFTEAINRDPEVMELLKDHICEQSVAQLKGIDGDVEVYRVKMRD
jgi:class 3 adenylate cyclase